MVDLSYRRLCYCEAAPSYAAQAINLLGNIAPATQRFIYGSETQRVGYMKVAFCQNLGYFGYSRHRLLLLDNRCIGIVASCENREHWRLDIETLGAMFRFYRLPYALKSIYRLIASASGSCKPSRGAYFIYNFAIDRLFSCHGFGTQLLHKEIARAQKQGYCSIELDVALNNPRAIVFYQRNGFKISQRLNNRTCVDEFHFERLLRMKLDLK